MYQSNQGHGIAGAKQIYSSKVKIGNWVEDNFGSMIASQEREPSKMYETSAMMAYKDPKDQPEPMRAPINMPTLTELKIKNKEGLPYAMLFNHGKEERLNGDRFKTTKVVALTKEQTEYKQQEGTLGHLKYKQVLEDKNLSHTQTTQARIANANVTYKVPEKPEINFKYTSESAPLPNWKKTSSLQ